MGFESQNATLLVPKMSPTWSAKCTKIDSRDQESQTTHDIKKKYKNTKLFRKEAPEINFLSECDHEKHVFDIVFCM